MTREEAIKIVRNIYQTDAEKEALATLIPELAESEDERIRKELIDHCIQGSKQRTIVSHKEDYIRWIAWLEKQKDQKPDIEICPRTKSKSFTEVYMKGWNDAKKEQKPAEWSEEDEKMLACTKEILTIADGDLSKKLNGDIIPITEAEFNGLKFGIAHCLSWLDLRLKSLRPQPKQEWTEKDDVMYGNLVCIFEGKIGILPGGWKQYTDWLKSIRERYTWRPSEEQLCALRETIEHLRLFMPEATKTIAELKELEDNLKKL